jgi:hypothetical protein
MFCLELVWALVTLPGPFDSVNVTVAAAIAKSGFTVVVAKPLCLNRV